MRRDLILSFWLIWLTVVITVIAMSLFPPKRRRPIPPLADPAADWQTIAVTCEREREAWEYLARGFAGLHETQALACEYWKPAPVLWCGEDLP